MNTTVSTPNKHTPAPYTGETNLNAMGRMTRYNRWIYDTIAPYLGQEILEAGCGNGNISRHILGTPKLKRFIGVDASKTFCAHLQNSIVPPVGVQCSFHPLMLENPELLSLAQPPFDTIVCLNVLEHIRDDRQALMRFHQMLAPGGRLVLQVPAFQSLYGTIDVTDQHFRRYTKKDLLPKVQACGFNVLKDFYFNLFGIAAWVWHGKVLKLENHTDNEMSLWDYAVPCLKWMESRVRPAAGLSLFVVAEKPHHA